MRKLLNTCVLVFVFCLCGCSDDDGPVPGLKVLSTTAKFDASGGEGKIEVQSPVAITAVSEETWCTVSVSGQTVNVTVPVNETITGRTAMVVITAGDETLKVPVYQAGDAFICDLSDYRFPIGGGSRAFSLKTSRVRDVSVTGVPAWLKYEIREEEIVFTADPAENDRFARVAVTNGISSVTAVFRQWSVEGTYSLSFMDNTNVQKSGTAVVKKNGDIYDVTTTGMVVNATIKVSYSEETSQMVISCGQDLGPVKTTDGATYWVKLCAYSDDNYLGWDTGIQYVADAEFDEATGKVRFEFKDNGTWAGKQVIGLYYGAFNEDGSYAKLSFGRATNLVMTKQ